MSRDSLSKFARIPTQDATLSRVQDQVEQGFRGVFNSVPIAQGVLIEHAFTGSADRVGHSLGRDPIGYWVVESNTPISIPVRTRTDDDTQFITLTGSAAVVKIWVF